MTKKFIVFALLGTKLSTAFLEFIFTRVLYYQLQRGNRFLSVKIACGMLSYQIVCMSGVFKDCPDTGKKISPKCL